MKLLYILILLFVGSLSVHSAILEVDGMIHKPNLECPPDYILDISGWCIQMDNGEKVQPTRVRNLFIKGNGEQCQVSMDSSRTIINTTCLQLTNSKTIKILCTKNKKMCKTEHEVQELIKRLEPNITFKEMAIQGSGEQCRVSMNSSGTIINTTCLQLTNSKKVKILCTKKKKQCKTIDEIRESLFVSQSNSLPGAYKTSYNCNKATTQTEKDICKSETVSALDYKLGNVYKEIKNVMSTKDFKELQSLQKKWIIDREQKCGQLSSFKKREKCMLEMYNSRLDSFSLLSASSLNSNYHPDFEEIYDHGTVDDRFNLAGYLYYKEKNIDKALKLLRRIVGENREDMLSAFMALDDMHADYAKTFENVSKELLEKNHNSIALSLSYLGGDQHKVQDVFLKEAYYLNMSAQIMLELDYRNNLSSKSYKNKILSFYRECSEDGVPRCQTFMGERYLYGEGVETNEDKGIPLLENADLDEAYYTLGNYFYGKKNIEKSKKYYLLAAEMKHVESIYNLGVFAQNEKDYKKSIKYFREAIQEDANYYPAIYELGRVHIEGWGVEKDYLKAIDILNTVVNNCQDEDLVAYANNAIAIAELLLGDESKGKEAFDWYTKSAEKNNMYAQYNLAKMYFNGKGTAKNDKKVIELYTKAAKQGHAEAQLYLGMRYWKGNGVKQDMQQALYWLEQSAKNGYAKGQVAYGLMLKREDKTGSLYWIKKAADQGNQMAIDYLKKYEEH